MGLAWEIAAAAAARMIHCMVLRECDCYQNSWYVSLWGYSAKMLYGGRSFGLGRRFEVVVFVSIVKILTSVRMKE